MAKKNYEKSDVELSIHSVNIDSIYINLTNPTGDTLYFCDIYLKFDLTSSPFLHRYREVKKEKVTLLALWPIVRAAGWRGSDRINLAVDGAIRKGRTVYHFVTLPPMSTTVVALPTKCLFADEFYKDKKHLRNLNSMDLNYMEDYIRGDFEANPTPCQSSTINIELGIYSNIDWYTDKEYLPRHLLTIRWQTPEELVPRPRYITEEMWLEFTSKICNFRIASLCVDLSEIPVEAK